MVNMPSETKKAAKFRCKVPRPTPEEHRDSHCLMHAAFETLMLDFIIHHPRKTTGNTTLHELRVWSSRQTQKPDEF